MSQVVEKATLTIEETAALLGISLRTAYALANKGELPGAARLGRRIVVSRRVLDEFLGGGRREEVGVGS